MSAEPEPVPTTAEEAAEVFRCSALACALSGRACGLRHAQTMRRARGEQVRAGEDVGRRDACYRCPAGAARVRLLELASVSLWRAPRPSARENHLDYLPPRWGGWGI